MDDMYESCDADKLSNLSALKIKYNCTHDLCHRDFNVGKKRHGFSNKKAEI